MKRIICSSAVFALVCVLHARAELQLGEFAPDPGSEQAAFYAENEEAIRTLIGNAQIGSTIDRRISFEQLATAYPDAALNLATELIKDQDVNISLDSARLLIDSIVMSDHNLRDTLPSGAEMWIRRTDAAKSVLREAIADDRASIRGIVASSLASLGDAESLEAIRVAVEEGLFSPVVAINYYSLAGAGIGAGYIAPYLESGSRDERTAAVSYLGAVPDYQATIRDILLDSDAANEIRAKAAEVLSRYDTEFRTYALTVTTDHEVPASVFGAVVGGYIDSTELMNPLSASQGRALKEAVNNFFASNADTAPEVLVRRLERF